MELSPVLFVAGVVVFVLAMASIGPVLSYVADKKLHRGVSWIRRRAVRRRGIRATATVIDVQYKTILGANDMVLEVHRDGFAPYRVEVAEAISLQQNHFALSGMTIAVFVDPNDPKTVVVDLVDLDRRVRQENVDAKERHARMLGGG